MTKNNLSSNNDNHHINYRSYSSMLEKYTSIRTDDDKLIHNIYFYIGGIAVCLVIIFGIIIMINKCIKYYYKDEQIDQTIQSNTDLRRVLISRNNSSVRNSFVSNHRSSLDIRFQMEPREQRLSQAYLIPLTS